MLIEFLLALIMPISFVQWFNPPAPPTPADLTTDRLGMLGEDWQCDPKAWVGTPGMGRDDQFHSTIGTFCTIVGRKGGGFPLLESRMVQEVHESTETLHAGPDATRFMDLPGHKWDITTLIETQKSKVRIRQDAYVATDRAKALAFATRSKKVWADGLAGYIRKFDITIHVTATEVPGTYRARLENSLDMERPWYIPSGTFKDQLKTTVWREFDKVQAQLVPEIANNL